MRLLPRLTFSLLAFFLTAYPSHAANESFTISPSGNIGVGTETPTSSLEVNGEIKAHSITLQDNVEGVKPGSLIAWFTATPPEGYLECDGSSISRTAYANLFDVVGTSFGSGDGSTTFRLPDLRGQFLRGFDNGAGRDPEASGRTDSGNGTPGDLPGTKQGYQLQSHKHSVDPPKSYTNTTGSHRHGSAAATSGISAGAGGAGSQAQEGSGTGYAGNHRHSLNIDTFNSATSGGSETRPLNISAMWIIKY